MGSHVELGLDEATFQKIRDNLESLMGLDINSDTYIRQVIVACLTPMVKSGEWQEEIGVDGREVEFGNAQKEFQDILSYEVKKYVSALFEKMNGSVGKPGFRKITQKSVTRPVFVSGNSNTVEMEIDMRKLASQPEHMPVAVKPHAEVVHEMEGGFEMTDLPQNPRDLIYSKEDEMEVPGLTEKNKGIMDASQFTEDNGGELPELDFDDFDF